MCLVPFLLTTINNWTSSFQIWMEEPLRKNRNWNTCWIQLCPVPPRNAHFVLVSLMPFSRVTMSVLIVGLERRKIALFLKKIIILQFNNTNFSYLQSYDNDSFVPIRFVTMLRIALPKVIARKGLSMTLIDQNFWKKMPLKFKAALRYESLVINLN